MSKLLQSTKNHSLCLDRIRLSLLDTLCFERFLNQCNTAWKFLDFEALNGQQVHLLTSNLMNKINCKRLEIKVLFGYKNKNAMKLLVNLFQSLFFHNVQECCITLYWETPQDASNITLTIVLLYILKLQHFKVLHFDITYKCRPEKPEENYIQIKKAVFYLNWTKLYASTAHYKK